jgi:ribonuclease E
MAAPVAVNETLPMFTETVDQQQLAQAEAETIAPVAPVIAEMPTQVTTTPVANAPVISVAPVADLGAVLAQAGLILASTDPNKLKAAQEAATQAPVAPRVIRERKAPVAVSDEPLIFIETKR